VSGFSEAWLADYQTRWADLPRRAEPVPIVKVATAVAEPISIRLELPLPPSVNALYANVPGKGRVKTKAYREWIRAASAHVLTQRFNERIDGSFSAGIDIFQRAGGDLDGRLKAIFDFCKLVGAIKDDRYLFALRVDLYRGPPRVLVRLNGGAA
jgi:Holliday junction resolvase RusA-like endonuclease